MNKIWICASCLLPNQIGIQLALSKELSGRILRYVYVLYKLKAQPLASNVYA